jgi:hypothetical protein
MLSVLLKMVSASERKVIVLNRIQRKQHNGKESTVNRALDGSTYPG